MAVPEGLTLITYMFLHTDILHLTSNMIFLWVFGDNIEDAMGHIKYLAFYVLCGIAAGLVQTLMLPTSRLPLIGASGAVAGTIAAYLILHPRVLVWVLAFRVIPLRMTRCLDSRVLGGDTAIHGAHQPGRPGGLVGSHRRRACGWPPHPAHAAARRAPVRSSHAARCRLSRRLVA